MKLSRRQFLRVVLAAGGLGAVASCRRKKSPPTGLDQWVNLGRVSMYRLDEPMTAVGAKTVTDGKPVQGAQYIVWRTYDDVRVVSSRCTHRGCTVEWKKKFFKCPCHGAEFAFDGSVVKGPAKKPLQWMKTRIVDDDLIILLPPTE